MAFAEKYGVQKVFTSFQDVCAILRWISFIFPHPITLTFTFCGKRWQPASMCCAKIHYAEFEELEEAVQLAKEHGVVLAEAMTIYHMPIYKELKNAWMPENSENCV